ATYSRNSSYSENVIYFGPMGCRTGFYFLVKDLEPEKALQLIKDTVLKCINHQGDIPGNSRQECGNYLEHDVKGANEALKKYYYLLKNKNIDDLKYKI
ncbi:MAG: S-ribosylhomocysteine lyase, partial [Oscillospiraceae bacterium]|nr:S-ribosylhomocysteine lyase [Oscillospiraceae bacterium]